MSKLVAGPPVLRGEKAKDSRSWGPPNVRPCSLGGEEELALVAGAAAITAAAISAMVSAGATGAVGAATEGSEASSVGDATRKEAMTLKEAEGSGGGAGAAAAAVGTAALGAAGGAGGAGTESKDACMHLSAELDVVAGVGAGEEIEAHAAGADGGGRSAGGTTAAGAAAAAGGTAVAGAVDTAAAGGDDTPTGAGIGGAATGVAAGFLSSLHGAFALPMLPDAWHAPSWTAEAATPGRVPDVLVLVLGSDDAPGGAVGTSAGFSSADCLAGSFFGLSVFGLGCAKPPPTLPRRFAPVITLTILFQVGVTGLFGPSSLPSDWVDSEFCCPEAPVRFLEERAFNLTLNENAELLPFLLLSDLRVLDVTSVGMFSGSISQEPSDSNVSNDSGSSSSGASMVTSKSWVVRQRASQGIEMGWYM